MDKRKAEQLAETELESYRSLQYETIAAKLGTQECFERETEDGNKYSVEVDFFYDDAEERNIRVTAMISNSFWTSISPFSSDFIVAPDGSFIGE